MLKIRIPFLENKISPINVLFLCRDKDLVTLITPFVQDPLSIENVIPDGLGDACTKSYAGARAPFIKAARTICEVNPAFLVPKWDKAKISIFSLSLEKKFLTISLASKKVPKMFRTVRIDENRHLVAAGNLGFDFHELKGAFHFYMKETQTLLVIANDEDLAYIESSPWDYLFKEARDSANEVVVANPNLILDFLAGSVA